ncbi:MAG: DNA mismatch repair endonuclease MutL [Christensenellales bacterium]
MGEIRRLSKSISDRIAAGEIVERPVSVVKELIENAIDANASAVSINIIDGGIKEICVTDNGKGISADDVELAFEKHATSKIYTENDLDYISTHGFRGEALYSISAISIVEMKTKRKDDETGTIIRISGGRFDYINPAGLPDGTSVKISGLFFNVPARLKFLKKGSREAAYISDLVSRYILAFPEISFHYTSQGKTIYHSSGNCEMQSAIYCVYGSHVIDNMVYVAHETNEIKVSGYVSKPGTVMKNRRAGSVFVNRRYVRNAALHDMIKSAYGETLLKGDVPFFALNIDLPVSAVDVNVHPNKLQVRFKDSSAVEYVIKEAVSQAKRCVSSRVSIGFPEKPAAKRSSIEIHSTPAGFQTEFFSGFAKRSLKEQENPITDQYNYDDRVSEHISKAEYPGPLADYVIHEKTLPVFANYKLIGSFSNTYVLIEQSDKLLIVDQHAAHERLLYEKYKNNPIGTSQPLLMPYIMTVSHDQKNLIDENIEIFNSVGFDIEPFGILEYKISAVPSIVYSVNVEELMNNMINEILQSGSDIVLKREAVIMTACRCAVKAGDRLSDDELKNIVDSFLSTNVIPTCPHGRPVISVITKKQIDKSFKRIV